MVGNCIGNPLFSAEKTQNPGQFAVQLSFDTYTEMEQVDIIADGVCLCSLTDIPQHFTFTGTLTAKHYFRVRGWGKGIDRKYSEGQYTPQFLLNPIFVADL